VPTGPPVRRSEANTAPLTTEVVTALTDFESLRDEWNELVSRVEFPEIFYTWEWNWFYYLHFRHRAPVRLVTVRQGGQLVGLAPLCLIERRALGRTVRVRVLEPIVGNLADYRNLLVDHGAHRWRIVQELVGALVHAGGEWDVVELRQLPSRDATTFQLLGALAEFPDLRHRMRQDARISRAYYGDAFGTKVDAKRLHRVRNKRAQLQREHALECRIGHDPTDEFWDAFLRLHQARWPESPLHVPAGRQLFADLWRHFASRGQLECSWLMLDGRPAAMHFGFRDDRKIYYYMPVLDEEFRQQRVGNILTLSMVEHYAATHQEFDFLRGDESYKLWWTDDVTMNYRLRIYRRSSFAAFADGFLPATKDYFRTLAFPGYALSAVRERLRRPSRSNRSTTD
jgi:CelD/BcsL family acetyltransferase involved in cellulose biosynthesis